MTCVPRRNYTIMVQIALNGKIKNYLRRDLSGSIQGTDGYRDNFGGPTESGDVPIQGNAVRLAACVVPGPNLLVKDVVTLESKLLQEKQVLEIVFKPSATAPKPTGATFSVSKQKTKPEESIHSTKKVPSPQPNKFWALGSTKREVQEVQGPPKGINRYPALGHEVWSYHGSDTVTFRTSDGKVFEWDNRSGKLLVALSVDGNMGLPDPSVTFTQGSTAEEVLRAQGVPKSLKTYASLGYEVLGYNSIDTITLSFKTGKVTEWNNSSGKLRIRR